MIFFVILGLLHFIMGAFLFGFDIRILKKGKCVIGKICEVEEAYRKPAIVFCIEVQFNKDGLEIKRIALEAFVPLPFSLKHKLSKLRKKHIGRQVHVYYNPDNDSQVLLLEYIWKDFLISAFIIFLGIIGILGGIFHWY